MAITTYAELKTAITTWTHRLDLATFADDFIDLSEAMFRRPVRRPQDPMIGGVRVEITVATGNLTASQANISKPSDFLEPISFDLTGSTGGRVEYLAPADMPVRFREGTGRPKFWSVDSAIRFNIAPDSTYAYSLTYWSQPDALAAGQTTNAIMPTYAEVYLSCCLYHAYLFTQDNENAALWLQNYKAAAWGASEQFRSSLYAKGSVASYAA